MNLKNTLTIFLAATVLYGCSSSSSDTDSSSSGSDSVAALTLPDNVEIFQDDNEFISYSPVNMAAYNSTGTDYSNSVAEVFIESGGEWQNPLKMADMLVCIMNASSHTDLANETFLAIVDMAICNANDRDGIVSNFAEVVVKSTRDSNTSSQNIDAFYKQEDDGSYVQFAVNVSMSKGASNSNPFGLFTFNWNLDNAPSGESESGTLIFSEESATEVRIKFIEEILDSSTDEVDWAQGVLNKNGSGGKLKVTVTDNSPSPIVTDVYNVNFNADYAHIRKTTSLGTNDSCMDLDESSMTTHVFDYDIFDTSGALKDITAGLPFFHGAGKALRGYAGSYSDHNDVRRNFVWTEDNSSPTLIYNENDLSITYNISYSDHDGLSSTPDMPVISGGMTFDDAVEFTIADNTPALVDSLNYEGSGKLWGIPWTPASGQWLPTYTLADGTELTDTNGTKWYVKKKLAMRQLAQVAGSFCTGLSVEDADIPYTKPSRIDVTTTWSDRPTMSGKPRVVHGVKKF